MSVKQIYPQSQKEFYSQNDSVDFLLSYEGQKLKSNTIRVSGQLRAFTNKVGTPPVYTPVAALDDIKYDGSIGFHGFCDSFNTQINGSFIENIQAYPRMVKTQVQANQVSYNQCAESNKSIELKTGNDAMSQNILRGLTGDLPVPFSFTPLICLNSSVGNMQYNGGVMLNIRFAPNIDVFFGTDSAPAQYEIYDLKLTYETVPDDGKKEQVILFTKTMVRNNIVSSMHQISAKVPVRAMSVSGTFVLSSKLSTTAHNNTICDTLGVTRLEFEINDTDNYVSFPVESREEILYNYILANNGVGNNDLSLKKLVNGTGYGIGLGFNGSIFDFTTKKFGLSISSNASNAIPYTLFLYFTGVVEV